MTQSLPTQSSSFRHLLFVDPVHRHGHPQQTPQSPGAAGSESSDNTSGKAPPNDCTAWAASEFTSPIYSHIHVEEKKIIIQAISFCINVLSTTWEQGRHKMNRPLQQNVHLPRQKYPMSFWCWHSDSISKLSLQRFCKWSITRLEYEFCKGRKAPRATHSIYQHLSIHQIDRATG